MQDMKPAHPGFLDPPASTTALPTGPQLQRASIRPNPCHRCPSGAHPPSPRRPHPHEVTNVRPWIQEIDPREPRKMVLSPDGCVARRSKMLTYREEGGHRGPPLRPPRVLPSNENPHFSRFPGVGFTVRSCNPGRGCGVVLNRPDPESRGERPPGLAWRFASTDGKTVASPKRLSGR